MTLRLFGIVIALQASLIFGSCSKDPDEPFGGKELSPDTAIVENNGSAAKDDTTTLIGNPGYCKGAGFSYDVTKPYGEGVMYQIFDAAYLQFIQEGKQHTYVTDDFSPYKEEEYYQAESESELSSKVSAKLSMGIDVSFFTLNASAGIGTSQSQWTQSTYVYKRSKKITYVRDFQYRNIVADALAGNHDLFSPGFKKDWQTLQAMNDNVVDPSAIMSFLHKWGVAFVTRTCLGGVIGYELIIDKSRVSSEFKLEAAVHMSLLYLLNSGINTEYKETHTYLSERSYSKIDVIGGDISRISPICKGEAITPSDYSAWLNSLDSYSGKESDIALVDLVIVPISELFSGEVKKEIERQINLK